MSVRRATSADAAAVGRIPVESWNVVYRGIMPDDVIANHLQRVGHITSIHVLPHLRGRGYRIGLDPLQRTAN